jgi:thiamine biosynthesis lipoprotein
VKDEPPVSAFVRLHESGPVHRFAHEAMATIFEVHAAHEDEAYARQAAHAVFALVDRLEQDLSRFVPNSDVSRVNVLAAGQVARVSPATMECLVIAWHMHELTEGAFDVTLGSGLHELELDPDELTVHARSSGVRLDLGGIGKGFAVDRAAALLEEWGVDRALVHGGWSSVLALEAPPGRAGWSLALRRPPELRGDDAAPLVARVDARQLALSASGTRKGDHILDPRTGAPAGERAVWVALPRSAAEWRHEAAVAEGLSTALMVLPRERMEALCQEHPGLLAWQVP